MENQLDEINVDLKSEIINEISTNFESKIAELRVDVKREMEEFKTIVINLINENTKVFGLFF